MAQAKEVLVPDIGGFESVDVIDVLVKPGDTIAKDDPVVSLESDKASMDVPAPFGGVVKEVKVKKGDKVGEGTLLLLVEVGGEEQAAPAKQTEPPAAPAKEQAAPAKQPEPPAAPAKEQAAQPEPVPEGEKAPAAAPAPQPEAAPSGQAPTPGPAEPRPAQAAPASPAGQAGAPTAAPYPALDVAAARAYASPAVRKFARELGVDLGRVRGSGRKGRITQQDVQGFVKQALAAGPAAAAAPAGGAGIPPVPAIDFSKFGPVEAKPLSRIRRATGANLHRSWLNVPHVTQHDEADVTDLEAFRKQHAEEVQATHGVKLTFLPFLIKACAAALAKFPDFNSSLAPDGESLIVKRYYHLGIAVDTPEGLVVPVIRDADRKGLIELARELAEVSGRAREGKLKLDDLTGGTFSISSLGGIGGTAFTPIVNAPEVAILGVSRTATRPVWRDSEWAPRLMLPLSLSYDHRVIDGAAAARFTSFLGQVLGDLRRLLL